MGFDKKQLVALVQRILGSQPGSIASLPTNGPDRHWNFRVDFPHAKYLLRIENPLAVKQRNTALCDEAKIVRFFSRYNLAPGFIKAGRYKEKNFLIEEWLHGKHLPKPGHLTRTHLRKLVEFFVRVNKVPLRRAAKLVKWKNDLLGVRARRKVIEARLKTGQQLFAFRKIIKGIGPLIEAGFTKLEKKMKGLSRGALGQRVFSYRDVTSSNILTTSPHYKAVDWERHSVGIADSSFSLVVLFRRFKLEPKDREFVIREYLRRRRVPHLRELIAIRNLERVLGEITWSFEWVARKSRIFPKASLRGDIRSTIQSTQRLKRELVSLVGPAGIEPATQRL